MPNSNDDLKVRVSVTETKVENIKDDLIEQKVVLNGISVKVDDLKERVDKMNGTLPRIQETCDNIERHLEAVKDASSNQKTKIEKNGLYVKLMWGLMLPVVAAVTGALVKLLFFGAAQ